MEVPILCLVAIIMVIWLLMLMSENRSLKEEVKKLKRQLHDAMANSPLRVEVSRGRKLTPAEINRVNSAPDRH